MTSRRNSRPTANIVGFDAVVREVLGQARQVARRAVGDAAALAMRLRMGPGKLHSWRKRDGTLATEADISIQEMMISQISSVFPDHQVLAEEDRDKDLKTSQLSRGSNFTWIIDPIDGTRLYVKPGSRYYGTGLALLFHGHPILSLFCAPQYSVSGFGKSSLFEAYFDEPRTCLDGRAIHIRDPRETMNESAIISRSVAAQIPEWKNLLCGRFKYVETRTGSGTLGLCRVAANGIVAGPAVYVFGQTTLWDIVIGAYVVQKAGGVCTTLGGESVFPIQPPALKLRYPLQKSIVAGGQGIVDQFVSLARARPADSDAT